MEKVLRHRVAPPARIAREHLPGQQAQVPALLQCPARGLHLRQGVRPQQGDGCEVLRPDPLAGQLLAVADRQSGGESGLAAVRGRLHRPGLDRHLARAELLRRKAPRARLRDGLPRIRIDGVDDRTDRPQDVLPDRPDRGLAARLGRLQAELPGHIHRAAALPEHRRL